MLIQHLTKSSRVREGAQACTIATELSYDQSPLRVTLIGGSYVDSTPYQVIPHQRGRQACTIATELSHDQSPLRVTLVGSSYFDSTPYQVIPHQSHPPRGL